MKSFYHIFEELDCPFSRHVVFSSSWADVHTARLPAMFQLTRAWRCFSNLTSWWTGNESSLSPPSSGWHFKYKAFVRHFDIRKCVATDVKFERHNFYSGTVLSMFHRQIISMTCTPTVIMCRLSLSCSNFHKPLQEPVVADSPSVLMQMMLSSDKWALLVGEIML